LSLVHLHLHSLRWSQRRIAAELQLDREMVSRYMRLSRESAPTVQADPNPAKAPISGPGAAEEELSESAPANDAAHAASSDKPRHKPANTTAEQATNPA
jgi:transcriptional regulator with XRE-family HTH domain